jgi:hypothetical protein
MISFAGVQISACTAENAAWIERNLSFQDVFDFARHTWPGPGVLPLGLPPLPRARPVKTETLFWQRDAVNFAVAYFVINKAQLDAIRTQVYPNAAPYYVSQPLVLNDGQNSLTAAQMWMLPARPLQQIPLPGGTGFQPSPGDTYLLTLVDQRFFWWNVPAIISVDPGVTNWTDLYAQINTALNLSPPISVDSIPTAYLQPSADYGTLYQPLPLLLDAIALAVGHRIVTDPTTGYVYSKAALSAAATQAELLGDWPPAAPNKIAGGLLALSQPIAGNYNNLPVTFPSMGGPITDLNGALPSSVTVTFPQPICGEPADPFPITIAAPASATEIGVITGNGSSKVINTTATYNAMDPGPFTALAQQAATDYYRWAVSQLDLKQYGVIPWVQDALSQSVEWTARIAEYSTRIQRPPWNADISFQPYYGSAGSFSPYDPVLPIDIQHNGIEVGADATPSQQPILDFDDTSSFQWVITPDPLNCKNHVLGIPLVPGIPGPVGPQGPQGPPGPGQPPQFIDLSTGILWIWAGNQWFCFPSGNCIQSGSGSGSGSGAGGGGSGTYVTSPCCPGVQIPTTLYAHFSIPTGACSPCMNAAPPATMVYSTTSQEWMAITNGLPVWKSPCTSSSFPFTFYCINPTTGVDGWGMTFGGIAQPCTITLNPLYSFCSPIFQITFDVVFGNPENSICPGTGTMRITFLAN